MIGRWKVFNLRVIICMLCTQWWTQICKPSLCGFEIRHNFCIPCWLCTRNLFFYWKSHWVDFLTPCANQNSAVSITDLPPLIQLFPCFSFFRQWLVLFAMHQLSLGLFRLVSAVGRILVLTQSFGACCIVILLALGGFIVSRGTTLPCSPPKDVSSTSLTSLAWFRHGSSFKY
jgi:hypothetical protein